jgi:hypothetical protein
MLCVTRGCLSCAAGRCPGSRKPILRRYQPEKTTELDYKKHKVWAENFSIVLQLGLTMAGCIVFCFFVGRYLDETLGSRGLMTAGFTVFGVVGGAVVSYRQIQDLFKDDPPSGSDSGNGSH